ncbi:MAG: diguanylate cyclase [Gemmataceae bacterium]
MAPKDHDWQSRHLDSLLRASRSVAQMDCPEQLLQSVLDEMVTTLDAQQGAILLWNDSIQDIQVRASLMRRPGPRRKRPYSETLVRRVLQKGESQFWTNSSGESTVEEIQSVKAGQMASIICAILQTPHRCLGVVHLDRGPMQDPFTEEELKLTTAIASTVSGAIESAQLLVQQRQQLWQTMNMLCQAIELRDPYTGGHAHRVTEYSLAIAKGLGLSPTDIYQLQMGGPLHDIGKIGVHDSILRKPGKLTVEEFEQIQMHTVHGATILETIPALRLFAPIARSHHEKWDGTGYPDQLAGEDIPFLARVVAVGDTFDAMTSDRPYRKGLPLDRAFDEIERQAGKQFDARCVEAFLKQRETICQLHHSLAGVAETEHELTLPPVESPSKNARIGGNSPEFIDAYHETVKTSLTPKVPDKTHNGCLVQVYPAGPDLGARMPLSEGELIIGRSSDAHLSVDDIAASRHHVKIQLTPEGFVATDLNSTNGTYVNTEPITTHVLHDGDDLQVGSRIYRFLSGGNLDNEYREEIYRLTIMDGLTNLHNKRYLMETLERELHRARHHRRPLSLLLLDVDRYKDVVSEHSHLGGDVILRDLAKCLQTNLRTTEVCARHGGEEFGILLPEVPFEGAVKVAERLRSVIEKQPFEFEEKRIRITVSIGVVTRNGDEVLTPLEFVRQAGEKLLRAKREGMNCVIW